MPQSNPPTTITAHANTVPPKPPKHLNCFPFNGLGFLLFLFIVLFTCLGIWQVKRLAWKETLIAQVNMRLHTTPNDAPMQAAWPKVNFNDDEYRPVRLHGRFLNDKETLVITLTNGETGYWILTPFLRDDHTIVFVNRGFIPMDKRKRESRENGMITGKTTVTGLLRMGESNGFFPRANKPAQNIWYTRQLPAIAQKLHLTHPIAPYFVDADATPNQGGWPKGGLTLVTFPNNHLSYAITWFLLALGVLTAFISLSLSERRKKCPFSPLTDTISNNEIEPK
ncbi:SURF1 family protein [Bartonella sp. DGB2]|uniref:SURF1 family protein n=1 Tax=Bartonella sp. DGB2 TaxID=3388426 RepID=UPI00398FC78F